MDPQNSRRPRLVMLVLLAPELAPELAQLLVERPPAEPRPEPPAMLALQVPRLLEPRALPVQRVPVQRVMPAPQQVRRPRSHPRVLQLRQPRARRCPTSTT